MKKKFFTMFVASILLFTTVFITGCFKRDSGQVIDKNKTQIYISVYDGGTGTSWIEKLRDEWNKTNKKYEVVTIPETRGNKVILDEIIAANWNKTSYVCYLTGETGFQKAIYSDKLEDLTPLINKKVDGENGGTIKDKIGAQESFYGLWEKAASKRGDGLYMLPYCDSFGGLIFDYQDFVDRGYMNFAPTSEKGNLETQGIKCVVDNGKLKLDSYSGNDPYFNYKKGDYILSLGKDGKCGSYDDGQPSTLNEWDQMLARIKANTSDSAFYWTGEADGYVGMIYEAVFAQYAGLEEYYTKYLYDGNVTIDGKKVPINIDNGYKAYASDAFQYSLEFINNYLLGNAHSYTNRQLSNTDAQAFFLNSYQLDGKKVKHPAMLVDGEWFENEASAVFNTEEKKEQGRDKGKRDYRFMNLPKVSDFGGIDGKGNGTIYCAQNTGAILVPKNENKELLNQLYDFLAFTLKEENLQKFTIETGITNAYSYKMTNDILKQMTPFARACNQMYMDTKNIDFVHSIMTFNSSPMKFATGGGYYTNYVFLPDKDGNEYTSIVKALKGSGVASMAEGIEKYYRLENMTDPGFSRATWKQLVSQCRAQGFYPIN